MPQKPIPRGVKGKHAARREWDVRASDGGEFNFNRDYWIPVIVSHPDLGRDMAMLQGELQARIRGILAQHVPAGNLDGAVAKFCGLPGQADVDLLAMLPREVNQAVYKACAPFWMWPRRRYPNIWRYPPSLSATHVYNALDTVLKTGDWDDAGATLAAYWSLLQERPSVHAALWTGSLRESGAAPEFEEQHYADPTTDGQIDTKAGPLFILRAYQGATRADLHAAVDRLVNALELPRKPTGPPNRWQHLPRIYHFWRIQQRPVSTLRLDLWSPGAKPRTWEEFSELILASRAKPEHWEFDRTGPDTVKPDVELAVDWLAPQSIPLP